MTKQDQFASGETIKNLVERSLFLERVILVQLAKCLSDEFHFYLSTHFGDIKGGYDIVGIDRESNQTEFVIDVTLGKKHAYDPISPRKSKRRAQRKSYRRDGVRWL